MPLIVKCWVTTRLLGVPRMTKPRLAAVTWRANVPVNDVDNEVAKARAANGPDDDFPSVYVYVFNDDDSEPFVKALERASRESGVPYERPRPPASRPPLEPRRPWSPW